MKKKSLTALLVLSMMLPLAASCSDGGTETEGENTPARVTEGSSTPVSDAGGYNQRMKLSL